MYFSNDLELPIEASFYHKLRELRHHVFSLIGMVYISPALYSLTVHPVVQTIPSIDSIPFVPTLAVAFSCPISAYPLLSLNPLLLLPGALVSLTGRPGLKVADPSKRRLQALMAAGSSSLHCRYGSIAHLGAQI